MSGKFKPTTSAGRVNDSIDLDEAKPKIGQYFDIDSVAPGTLLQYVQDEGGQRAFTRNHPGVKRSTLQTRLYRVHQELFRSQPVPEPRRLGRRGVRAVYFLGAAQDNTDIYSAFLTNVEAYASWYRRNMRCTSDILISGFTYNKSLFEDHASQNSFYHERVLPYLTNERVRISDRVDFCGEMNILPTKVAPLSGFDSYTQNRWGIFPHAKVQLESVPTMRGELSKQNMTTGCFTRPNYVQKTAGHKAQHHHIAGCVIVEVIEDGRFFCRQIIADEETGSFQDLDRVVDGGEISTGNRIDVSTPGDIHTRQIDNVCSRVLFGIEPNYDEPPRNGRRVWETSSAPTMISDLRPRFVMGHDILDFLTRNHHGIKDPHKQFEHYVNGQESVYDEVGEVAMLATHIEGRLEDGELVIVDSNHDRALMRWLKEADYRKDPVNAEFFLRCQAEVYASIRRREKGFSIVEWAMRNLYPDAPCSAVRFLRPDNNLHRSAAERERFGAGFKINGVEHTYHGHNGSNGARGSLQGFSKITDKVTFGHIHTPGIRDGAAAAGTTSLLDLGYNDGPSSWAHAFVVQYPTGKRAVITMQGDRYRM